MRITKDELDLSITRGEWSGDDYQVQINHPAIRMTDMVSKAMDTPGFKLWEAWVPEDDYAHFEHGKVRVCITDGTIFISGGMTPEGDDVLDGSSHPQDLSLSDMLDVVAAIRPLIH